MKQTVGFIGVGNMGYGMVANLLKKGFGVMAYDVDSTKLDAVVSLGATRAKNVQEVSNQCETTLLALPHPKISRTVLFGKRGLIHGKRVQTIIEASTLKPDDAVSFHQELRKHDVRYLGAPMLAGSQMAREGRILFLVEGDKAVYEKHKHLFQAMGKDRYMGSVPNATVVKLAYNMCRYSTVATALEVIAFLKTYMDDLKGVYDVLREGSLDNFGQVWKEEMEEVTKGKPYKFAGSKIPEKDLTLFIQLLKQKGLSPRFYKEIRAIYRSLKP